MHHFLGVVELSSRERVVIDSHASPEESVTIQWPWFLRSRNYADTDYLKFFNALSQALFKVIRDPGNYHRLSWFVDAYMYRRQFFWMVEHRGFNNPNNLEGLSAAIREAIIISRSRLYTPESLGSKPDYTVMDPGWLTDLESAASLSAVSDENHVKGLAHSLHYAGVDSVSDFSSENLVPVVEWAFEVYGLTPYERMGTDPW